MKKKLFKTLNFRYEKIITLTILIILYVNFTVFAHSSEISDGIWEGISEVFLFPTQTSEIPTPTGQLRFPKVSKIANCQLPTVNCLFLIELPGWINKKFFGLQWKQYLLILLLIFISFVIHKILSWFFSNLLVKILAKTGRKELYEKYIRPVTRPFSLFIIFCLLYFFIPLLDLPVTANKYVSMGIKAIIPLYGILIFYRLVDILGAYLNRLAAKTESALDDQLVPLISKSLKVFVVIMGVLFILQEILNVNITALLAGLSIGGLAFALAAQDTIKNFFGSLMVFIDRPFHIGDWIVSNDVDGMVEEVGFRSTRIRTFHNSVISIPNGKLADMTIDNMGLRAYRRFNTSISITYDTPPDAIEAFVEGLRQIVEKHPNTRKDYYNIYLNEMAGSSLNILFYVFFSVPDWTGELKARQEIILSIIRLAETLGIRFAFPTETIHVENFPEKKSLTPVTNTNKGELMKKLAGFIKSGSPDKPGSPQSLS